MESPIINAFENGVLHWHSPDAAAYCLTVDGEKISDGADGFYRTAAFDVSGRSGDVTVEIIAVGSGQASAPTRVSVDTVNGTVTLLPVRDYIVRGTMLEFLPVGCASEYRIVDIFMRVVATVSGTRYDMTGKTLVYGVYPVSASKAVGNAEIAPVNIKYLKGEGTERSPYVITTPLELRAIDYYEVKYAESLAAARKNGSAPPRANRYRIDKDINYNAVAALDADSNFYTLHAPFYGVLDGNGKRLANIRVFYDGGYWAMFDYIAAGGAVVNLVFDAPEITNRLQTPYYPLDAAIATVADSNYGTIRGIEVRDARYTASGGAVCGICSHNYGVVTECFVGGNSEFRQESTGQLRQACYEMAGVVCENYGFVTHNTVQELTVRGSVAAYFMGREGDVDRYGEYNNVKTVGGMVSVNRAGGVVAKNKYGKIDLCNMLDSYDGTCGGYEYGGMVAYNAGAVVVGGDRNIGIFTWSPTGSVGNSIKQNRGTATDQRGKIIGKDARENRRRGR